MDLATGHFEDEIKKKRIQHVSPKMRGGRGSKAVLNFFKNSSILEQFLEACYQIVSKSPKVVSNLSQCCPKVVSKLSLYCLYVISNMPQHCLKAVPKLSQGCQKVKLVSKFSPSLPKLCQSCLNDVPRLSQSYINIVSNARNCLKVT